MGTRGFITFVIDGQEKTAYNQFDSYPEALGSEVLTWLRMATNGLEGNGLDLLRERVRNLRVVGRDEVPTPEEILRLKEFADTHVDDGELTNWYVLLRKTQGNPAAILRAGRLLGDEDFPLDSLFAEYGYVVDLDEEVFEAYQGYQKSPHTEGRFATRPSPFIEKGYWPVKLVGRWPLKDLPRHGEFNEAFHHDEDDD